MFGIILNNAIVRSCTRLIRCLPGIQHQARKRLVNDLQSICSKCEDAYSALLARLLPIKTAYSDPKNLVEQLRLFSADIGTRAAFKPEHLCGEIDHLLQELKSNLNSLGYSLRLSGLETLDETLRRMGNYDSELYHEYDQFRSELDDVATKISGSKKKADREQWLKYVEELIADTESELKQSVTNMRKAKDQIVQSAF